MNTQDQPSDQTAGDAQLAAARLPALSPADRSLLHDFMAHRQNPVALAKTRGLEYLDIIDFTSRPDILLWINHIRALRFRCRRDAALDELERCLTSSRDPIERRRAATTILRATDPARFRRQSPQTRLTNTPGASPPATAHTRSQPTDSTANLHHTAEQAANEQSTAPGDADDIRDTGDVDAAEPDDSAHQRTASDGPPDTIEQSSEQPVDAAIEQPSEQPPEQRTETPIDNTVDESSDRDIDHTSSFAAPHNTSQTTTLAVRAGTALDHAQTRAHPRDAPT